MANFLLAPFSSVVDTDGARVALYRLHWGNSFLGFNAFGFVTDLAFALYLLLATPAVWLLGLLFDPQWWLSPLSTAYEKITQPLYSVVPPMFIAIGAMVVLLVSIVFVKSDTDTFGALALNRVAAGFGMMILVAALAANPFELLIKVLTFGSELIRSVTTEGPNPSSMQAELADSAIRTPAQMLNFGQPLSEECSTQWSTAQANGAELADSTGCYNAGADDAEAGTVMGAVGLTIAVGIPLVLFSIASAWKFILHISLCALSLLTAPWQIAVAIPKRRGFEIVSGVVARILAHLTLAVVIAWLSALLPTIASELTVSLAAQGEAQAGLALIVQAAAFLMSWLVIVKVANNSSFLVRMLRVDPSRTLEATIGARSAAAVTKRGAALSDALVQRPYNLARTAYLGATGAMSGAMAAGLGMAGSNQGGQTMTGPRPWSSEAANRRAFDRRSVLLRAGQRAIAAPRWQDALGQARASVLGDMFGYWWQRRNRPGIDEEAMAAPRPASAQDSRQSADGFYRYGFRSSGDAYRGAETSSPGRHRPDDMNQRAEAFALGRGKSTGDGLGGSGTDFGGPGPGGGTPPPSNGGGPGGPSSPAGGGSGGVPPGPTFPGGGSPTGGPGGGPVSGGPTSGPTAGIRSDSRRQYETSGQLEAAALRVRGNTLADPVLGSAAAAVGATFRPARVATPFVPVPPDSVLPTITGRPLSDAAPLPLRGPRPIAFNPPLTMEPVDSPAVESRARTAAAEVTPYEGREFREDAGLVPGENIHPGSFLAPLPDVLAAAQRDVDFRKLRALASRDGNPVTIRRDPDDPLIRMWFTSDIRQPVKAAGLGFGDKARPRSTSPAVTPPTPPTATAHN